MVSLKLTKLLYGKFWREFFIWEISPLLLQAIKLKLQIHQVLRNFNEISEFQVLQTAAAMLDVQSHVLSNVLTSRSITTGGGRRQSQISIPLNAVEVPRFESPYAHNFFTESIYS